MDEPESTRRDFLSGRLAGADNLGDHSESLPTTGAGRDRVLTSLSKTAMACWFEFFVDAQRFPRGPEIAQHGLEIVEEIERELSVYMLDSHLSQVNRFAAAAPVQVSPHLLALLTTSLELFADTRGAFDVTAGPLSKVWGFYNRNPKVPSREEIEQALGRVGSQHIELDRKKSLVRFLNPELEINLASIGKGFALDRAADYFRANGVSEFVLHGGQSSVLAWGCQDPLQPQRGWPIGLVHPVLSRVRLGMVHLQNRALGTSGNQRQWLIHEGRRLGHVLDPRTGWPVMHTLSATVLAPTAALADALSTAFSVMTIDQVSEYCRRHSGISAIVCTADDAQPGAPQVHVFNLSNDEWRPEGQAAE